MAAPASWQGARESRTTGLAAAVAGITSVVHMHLPTTLTLPAVLSFAAGTLIAFVCPQPHRRERGQMATVGFCAPQHHSPRVAKPALALAKQVTSSSAFVTSSQNFRLMPRPSSRPSGRCMPCNTLLPSPPLYAICRP